MGGDGTHPKAGSRYGIAGRPIWVSLAMACFCSGLLASAGASSISSHFFIRNLSSSFITLGMARDLDRSCAYLHDIWQPAWLDPRLGSERRHAYDICLIHQADIVVLQVQLDELFIGDVQIVIETGVARGQEMPHDASKARTIHQR